MVCCVLRRKYDTATHHLFRLAEPATVVGISVKSASIACFPQVWLTTNGQVQLALDAVTFGGRTAAWIDYTFTTPHHGVEQLYLKCKSSQGLTDAAFVDLVSVRIVGWTPTPLFRSAAPAIGTLSSSMPKISASHVATTTGGNEFFIPYIFAVAFISFPLVIPQNNDITNNVLFWPFVGFVLCVLVATTIGVVVFLARRRQRRQSKDSQRMREFESIRFTVFPRYFVNSSCSATRGTLFVGCTKISNVSEYRQRYC